MAPKLAYEKSWEFHSDVAHSFTQLRDRKNLLRSVGHPFRDGRWTGGEDDFHQFRVEEIPALGSRRTFDGSSYWTNYSLPPIDQESHVTYNWCPVVGRSFTTAADTVYEQVAPDPEDPDFADSVLELNNDGTSFIRRNRPGNPLAHFGQFIGELHQLPQTPIFLRSRAKKFRDLGSEYLNIEFGWLPFVRDLVGIYKLQQRLSKVLHQLIAGNGLRLRRRSKKLYTSESTVIVEGVLTTPFGHLGDLAIGGSSSLDGYYLLGPWPYWDPNPGFTGSARYSMTETIETVSWQCGTFQYYVPDIGSDRWSDKCKQVLFGLDPSPSLLWELYPWTWLIDWFANVGDIVSNLTTNALDNETLTNAFAMKQNYRLIAIDVDVDWDELDFAPFDPEFHFDLHAHVPAGSDKLNYLRKETEKLRHQASPFGFGLSTASFTARQWAILAALGISRQRR